MSSRQRSHRSTLCLPPADIAHSHSSQPPPYQPPARPQTRHAPQDKDRGAEAQCEQDAAAGDTSSAARQQQATRAREMIELILQAAQSLLSHHDARVRRSALEAVAAASSSLCAMPRALDPHLHTLWPLLCRRLKDESPPLRVQAAEAIRGCVLDRPDFLLSRATDLLLRTAGDVLAASTPSLGDKALSFSTHDQVGSGRDSACVRKAVYGSRRLVAPQPVLTLSRCSLRVWYLRGGG